MKKNAVIILAVIAISVATVKTGYAFYGKQISNNQTNETSLSNYGENFETSLGNYGESSGQSTAQTDFYQQENIPELPSGPLDSGKDYPAVKNGDITFTASGQADGSNTEGNCCGSGSVNMLDENGNLKDRDTFSKELDEALQNGEITEEDKEFYLYMYEQCAVAFGAGGTQSGSAYGGGNFPGCH